MKKLLSILSISGIVGSSSSMVVSCDNGTAVNKADISGMTFTENPGRTWGSVYGSVRQAIADKGKTSVEDIQTGADAKNVLISVWNGSKEINENDSTLLKVNDKVAIKVKVTSASTIFAAMDWKEFDVTVSKVDLSKLAMPSITAEFTGEQATDAVRTSIAKLTNTTADKIKLDDNISIAVWNDGKQVDKSTAKLTGKSIDVKISVNDKDANYAKMDWKVFNVKFADLVTLDTTKLNLKDVAKVGTTYADVYNTFRTEIAATAKIDSSVILSGIEKDNVLLFMKINDKNVGSTTDTIKAGNKISAGFQVTENSLYYNKTDKTEYTKDIQVSKATVSNDIFKGITFKVGDKYQDMYTSVRTDIAKIAGLKASDIATGGTEANNVIIWLYIDGISKPLADSNTQIQSTAKGKEVSLKIEIKNSKVYNDLELITYKLATITDK